MKNKIRRLSKGSLSVVLSIMMVISTMLIGSFTVNAVTLPEGDIYLMGLDNNWETPQDKYKLTYVDGNKYTGEFVLDGKSDNYMFKLYCSGNNQKYTKLGQVFSGASSSCAGLYIDSYTGTDMKIAPIATSGQFKIEVTVYREYSGDSRIEINQKAITSTDPETTHYYIGGRFMAKNASGEKYYTSTNEYYWNESATNMEFVDTDKDGIYEFDTNCTLGELSNNISDQPPYFIIHTGSGTSGKFYALSNGSSASFTESTNQLKVNAFNNTSAYSSLLFSASNSNAGPVTLKFDSVNMTLSYDIPAENKIHIGDVTGGGSIACTVDGSPAETAKSGDTVTVTVTPTTSTDVCKSITVTGDDDSNIAVTRTGNTATFIMPNQSVTVTATVGAPQTFTVTTAVNDSTMGSVAIEGATGNTTTVTEGESVTLTATANSGYEFENWTVDNTTYAGDVDITSPSITVYPTSNVTFTANFAEEKGEETGYYFLISTDPNPNNWNSDNSKFLPVYLSDDTYYVDIVETDYVDLGLDNITSNIYGAVKSSQSYGATNILNDTNSRVNTEGNVTARIEEYSQIRRFYISASSSDVERIHIEFDNVSSSGRTYTVTAIDKPVDPTDVNVYAKNGTVCSYGTGTSKYGVTTITNDDIVSDSDNGTYKVYTAKEGDTLEIQTVVNSSYYSAGYYVAAFQANGQTLEAEYQGQGIYTAEYLIPDDFEENLEITPVYYNRNIEEAGDYVTLYVDPSQLPEDDRGVKLWTNQIACYPYYYTGNGTEAVVIDGDYPGQPMLKAANGKWYTKVSKYYYDESGQKGSYKVSGITLNNYTTDSVHGSLVPDGYNVNRQTYDFDDFVKIAEADYDIVEFRIEYRGGSYASNQQLLINNATDYPDPSGSIKFDQYDSKGWVALKDYKDNYVSLTYDILDKTQAESNLASDNFLRVISVGNQNVSDHGVWSTVWYVFDQSGKFITKGVPSDFLPTPDGEFEEGSNAKAVHEALANYKSIPVKICYEKEMNAATSTDSGNSGVRIDGQWYFGKTSDPIDANVIVEVPGSEDGTWVTDTSGSNKATIDGQTSVHYVDREHIGSLVAQAGSGYMFAGWGYLNENGEFVSFDNSTKLNTSVSVPLNQNYTFVARFVPVTDGTLVVSHSKYTGSGAYGGAAYYYVSAVAHNADGTTTTYRRVENSSLSIKVNPKDVNKIDFTVTVIPKGDNSYVGTYRRVAGQDQYEQICEKDDFVPGSDEFVLNGKEYSIKFTTTVSDLYDERGQQSVNTFAFYSDVAPVTTTATLNYKYENRFGVINNYTKVVDLTDEYIDAHGKTITDELVYENAPAIDDLHKDCTWKIEDTKYTVNGMVATLTATQEEKMYRGTIDIGVGEKKSFEGIKYNEFLKTDDGDYYRCPDEENFQYWSVKEYGTDKEVARFYHPWFALRIVDDYDIVAICGESADVQDNVYIGSPVYTREQITDPDGTNKQDYLYADFLVAYMGKEDIKLSQNSNYKTGLLIETNANAVISGDNIVDGSADYSSITFDSLDEKLEIIATSGRSGKFAYYTDEDNANKNSVTNFIIDNNDYSNLNRMDYYVRFNNTEANTMAVMKAYYYVYQVDDEGNVIEDSFKITECVYFNLYDISQSTPNTSA